MTGQADNAAMAASHVATLQSIPTEVVTATGLFMDGDLDVAEAMVRAHLLKHGNQVEAMRLLARIGIARKVFDDAELLLATVLDLAPDYRAARKEYAEVLVELHKYSQARRELERLLEEDPQNRPHYQGLYATTTVGLGEHERSVALYRELLQGTPEDAETHLSIAHALKTLGRRDEAIESYRRAAACRPNFGDAYWSLANLKTYRFTDDELTLLRVAQADPTIGLTDRFHLCFALGKALEDRGEFAESFHYYTLGNALKRSESKYRPEIIENNTRLQIEVCTGEFFASRRGWGAQNPDPIFIVGLPRSGSTLIEQILASHSKVEGTQELANVLHIVSKLRGHDPDPNNQRYPRILTKPAAEDFRQLGEKYLADTRVYRTDKPFFIDKMPNNFRHLGLIRLMLPNSKIIDARREPIACCFSNLKQLFATGQEFTYGVEDIARYYRTYLELMRHWNRVLPGWILRVHHEDVVDDLEGSVRRILDFCGLDFEPQCIEFHKTVRSVRTASSEQVRLPLYREGLDQWKNFDPWLGPLKAALGEALNDYSDG
jgi:tetratricopeptide (TPR) repeat protein